MRKPVPLIVVFFILAGIFGLLTRHTSSGSDEPVVLRKNPRPDIVMFSTQSCRYCQQARDFFQKHSLMYEEKDIDQSDEHRRMFDLLGGRGTPLLIINKEIIYGYDEQAIRKAL